MISFGAGLGGDVVAAKSMWPGDNCLSAIHAVEPMTALSHIGRLLTDGIPGVAWSPGWGARATDPADLVVAGFALGEPDAAPARSAAAAAADAETRRALVRDLWARCGGVLVLVEAGTPAGLSESPGRETRMLPARFRSLGLSLGPRAGAESEREPQASERAVRFGRSSRRPGGGRRASSCRARGGRPGGRTTPLSIQ